MVAIHSLGTVWRETKPVRTCRICVPGVQDKDTGAHHTPRTVYFYLVETNGEEHLAAVGEAQDESSPHTFSYKFTESFRNEEYGPSPPLYNKHNVREWLNSIISQSHLLAESGMGNFAASSSSRQYVKHDHEYAPSLHSGVLCSNVHIFCVFEDQFCVHTARAVLSQGCFAWVPS